MHKLSPPPASQEIFTLKEACSYARLGQTHMRQLLKERKIRHMQLPNGDIRLRKADLDGFLDSFAIEPFNASAEIDKLLSGKNKKVRSKG